MADFSYKQTPAFSQVMDLVANKRLKEQQIRESQQNVQKSQVDMIRGVAADASSMVSGMVTSAREKQKQSALKDLSEMFMKSNDPTPGTLPAGIQGPQPQYTVNSQTPEFKNQARSLLFKAAPEIATKEMAESVFAPIGGRQGTPPRTLEGVYVDQYNQGMIDEPTMLKKIQENNPEVTIVEDPGSGMRYVYDRRTGQSRPLFAPAPAPATGRDSGKQFTPSEKETIAKARTEYNASPDVKELSVALSAAERARKIIKENPKGAPGLIRTNLAKMVENNRLSDQDIERISGSPALADRIIRSKSLILEGKMSEVDQKDFLAIVDIMESAAADELQSILDNTIESLTFDISNANPEALKRVIGRGDVQKLERIMKKRGSSRSGVPVVGETFNGAKVLSVEPVEE